MEITDGDCYRNIEHFLFCVRPFALHRQQPQKDKQNVDFGKISADTRECGDSELKLCGTSLSLNLIKDTPTTYPLKEHMSLL